VNTFNSQHKNLFRMAAEFDRAVLAGTVKTKLFQLLDDVVPYTLVHFAYESSWKWPPILSWLLTEPSTKI
jgi:hemerythrin